MDRLLLRGGHLVDPASGVDEAGLDVLLAGGRVAAIGRRLEAGGARTIDASRLVVAPGFIDMHVHLREPGLEEAETIASGARAAAAGGFTAVACMPNTRPVNDSPEVTERIRREAGRVGLVRVWPIAAVGRGLGSAEASDWAALKGAGAVALSNDGLPVASSALLLAALEAGARLGLAVIDHCEDLALAVALPASEEAPLARDACLARTSSTCVHIAHVSTAGSVARLREEKVRGTRVTAEATPHHFTLSRAAVRELGTAAKMNPPLRAEADVEAVIAGLADGSIDCIASDHAPHLAAEKARPFVEAPNGVLGLETAVALALDRLFHRGRIGLRRLVELLSVAPARILGVPGGSLAIGAPADVTLVDLERSVTVVPERFESLSRNTPFAGWKLRGGPAATIVGGRLLWTAAEGFRIREGKES